MPIYPTLAVAAAVAVVVPRAGRVPLRAVPPAPPTGSRWRSVFAFMIPVDGWLTKLLGADRHLPRRATPAASARSGTSSLEEFAYAFALLTLVMLVWDRARRPAAPRDASASRVTAVVLVVGSFVAMEGVSYAAHRWVMHGRGMGWHRSHHAPPAGRFERNDLFPVCFSAVGVAAVRARRRWVSHAAAGGSASASPPTARLPVRARGLHPPPAARAGSRSWRYLRVAARRAPRPPPVGGEPYGMLLPVVPRRAARRRGRRTGDVAGQRDLLGGAGRRRSR